MRLQKQRESVSCDTVAAHGLEANAFPALITVSTRASLKRYHSYTLTLGLGEEANEYEFLRIGTASEKDSVEKEIHELHERLSKVDQWRQRRKEIDEELGKVWIDGQGEQPDLEDTRSNRSNEPSAAP